MLAGKESSASPFIGRRWRSGRTCEAERSAVSDGVCNEAGQKPARALVFDGAVATRAWSGVLVAGSVMRGGLRPCDGCGRAPGGYCGAIECSSRVSCTQRKGMAPRGAP